MDYIIEGKHPLYGELSVCGAKNCALALLGATVLTEEEITLFHCPQISDVTNMLELLKSLGKSVEVNDEVVTVKGHVCTTTVPESKAKLLRGSSLLLGSLVGKYNQAFLPKTGGCAIGKRPIDIHIDGLRAMGVQVQEENGVHCCGRPHGCNYNLRFASVGATENLLCAASMSSGTVTLSNCALEPEVVALEQFLQLMGADLQGIGTSCVVIKGVKKLHGAQFTVIPDRIVAATYLSCCVASGGKLTVTNCNPQHLTAFLQKLSYFSPKIYSDSISINVNSVPSSYGKTTTAPYPFFPTDMQQILLSLCALSNGGTSFVTEKIYENRLQHNAQELAKMGANISVNNETSIIVGGNLHGETVCAQDLRGGAGLVVAALGALGTTTVLQAEHILRGYSALEENLSVVGAVIHSVN